MRTTTGSRRAVCRALLLALTYATSGLCQDSIMLVGAGSNLPSLLYKDWAEEFNKRDPKIQFRYLSTTTAQSMEDICRGTGDFGAGEEPMSNEQLRKAKTPILHVPTALVAIVPIYHVPGVRNGVRFSGEVLAQIFLGTIKTWDDPKVTKLNPGVQLPSLNIVVVHRTEGKGSNYIFTDFLSKVSPEWRRRIGRGPSPDWPVGVSAHRGQDMVEKVKNTAGAIGYVELGFTERSSVSVGRVGNAAGRFVAASPETIVAAYRAVEKSIPRDFRVSFTNAPGPNAYPISSFTWLYVPAKGSTPERLRARADYLGWVLTSGQRVARVHGYTPLPESLVSKVQAQISLLR